MPDLNPKRFPKNNHKKNQQNGKIAVKEKDDTDEFCDYCLLHEDDCGCIWCDHCFEHEDDCECGTNID